eukprot:PhM_4_TR2434/c0_g3_i14/m.78667
MARWRDHERRERRKDVDLATLIAQRTRGQSVAKQVVQHIMSLPHKQSTKKNTLINIITALRRRSIRIERDPLILRLFRVLDEALLWEDPKKAPLLSRKQMTQLLRESHPPTAITLA